jgi:hypothetical protein
MEFEELFDGTLGEWDMDPVSFELNKACKPYPVPRLHTERLKRGAETV